MQVVPETRIAQSEPELHVDVSAAQVHLDLIGPELELESLVDETVLGGMRALLLGAQDRHAIERIGKFLIGPLERNPERLWSAIGLDVYRPISDLRLIRLTDNRCVGPPSRDGREHWLPFASAPEL